ncbi:hypothetical protein MAR_026495 [Mya arenaria]|uniref:Uncharacterized protein n=1 Tax=Mya arenaria TaxID=6604 RepID=A0ABY7ER46_MYAAR|nr:hypothetical protein MAR_026495 [Mya arenaria]
MHLCKIGSPLYREHNYLQIRHRSLLCPDIR